MLGICSRPKVLNLTLIKAEQSPSFWQRRCTSNTRNFQLPRQVHLTQGQSTTAFSQLTHKDVAFVWGKPQQKASDKLKSDITSAPMLAYFDNSKEIVGASSSGLGALIMQGGKAVAFSSKTLNSLGKMYANIERVASDCLGSEKFHMCRVTVETDHKPQYSIVLKADWMRMMLKLTMTLCCILSQENTGHFRLPWQSTSQWNRTSQWARRCNRS